MSSSGDEKPQKSTNKKSSSKDKKKKKEVELQSQDSNSKDKKDEKKSKPKQQKSSPRDDKDQKSDEDQKNDKKSGKSQTNSNSKKSKNEEDENASKNLSDDDDDQKSGKKSDKTQVKQKSKKAKSKDDDKETKNTSNDDDDGSDGLKSDKKSDKTQVKAKKKKSKNEDDDDEAIPTTDDSDQNDSDSEYDDPGYEFQQSEHESADSNNYSDTEYEEETDDYSEYSDDPVESSRNVHRIKRSHSHKIRKTRYKASPLPSSNYRPNKPSNQPSKYSKCDSDLSTDPTTQKGRKSIAKKTLKIITYGPNMGKYSVRHRDGSIEYVNIGKLISNSYKHTKTYPMNYYKDDQKKPYKQIQPHSHICKFEVLPISTFEAAKYLVKKERLKTCVLNYASATKPGGGFLHGRQAQEESLSRQSALYVTLKNSQMYEYNKDCRDDLYNDFMIYSSRVPVFRSSYHERLLSRRDVFVTSVITSAAPNLHNINQYGDFLKAIALWWKQYEKRLKHRCRKILLLAIDKGTEALVLGAYGCGVFENSPDKISEIYYKLLVVEGLGKYFVKIVFAIIDKKSQNFKAFHNRFIKGKS